MPVLKSLSSCRIWLTAELILEKTITGEFADEIQNDGNGDFYVHYHDSVCLYESNANALVDYYQAYDQPLDLKKLVKSLC